MNIYYYLLFIIYYLLFIFIKIAKYVLYFWIRSNCNTMADYSKMNCEDIKLFIFEWIILHPEAGKGIKYVRNLNKQDLIKVCLYIGGKLSKDVLMEDVIIPKRNQFREIAKQRAIKMKEGYDE